MATLYSPSNTSVTRLESPQAYVDYLRNVDPRYSRIYSPYDRFHGGTFEQALDKLEHGDLSTVDEAQKLIDKLNDAHLLTTETPTIQASVVGFSPLVPAAIMGIPESMLRRAPSEIESEHSPLTIYIETTVSAGVTHGQLIARGIATLGFVIAMQTMRPVDLYAVSVCDPSYRQQCNGVVVKIDTRPVDLARAAFMLTSPMYARRLAFIAMHNEAKYAQNSSIPWPWGSNPTAKQYIPSMREMLGCQPQDVFICGGYLYDKLMLNDPVQWVANMIKQHSAAIDQ